MSMYCCEGFVKEIEVVKEGCVSFRLEPAAPYLYEKKGEGGKIMRCLLFVEDSKNPAEAKVWDGKNKFIPPKPSDLNTLLIAKANRMKVRVTSDLEQNEAVVDELLVM